MSGTPEKTIQPASERTLEYQLEFLKLEFDSINDAISRIDETTQGTKNWAVIVWAGSLGISLGNLELRHYAGLTAMIPLLFWFIDGQWRRIQRSFIFRIQRISEFLNGPHLKESFVNQKLVGLEVLDPRGRKHRNTKEYKRFTSIIRTLRFREVGPFYLGLFAISIIVAAVLRAYPFSPK